LERGFREKKRLLEEERKEQGQVDFRARLKKVVRV
jgi:hypothetical protein